MPGTACFAPAVAIHARRGVEVTANLSAGGKPSPPPTGAAIPLDDECQKTQRHAGTTIAGTPDGNQRTDYIA